MGFTGVIKTNPTSRLITGLKRGAHILYPATTPIVPGLGSVVSKDHPYLEAMKFGHFRKRSHNLIYFGDEHDHPLVINHLVHENLRYLPQS